MWRKAKRYDILAWVGLLEFASEKFGGDFWISPQTGEKAPITCRLPQDHNVRGMVLKVLIFVGDVSQAFVMLGKPVKMAIFIR